MSTISKLKNIKDIDPITDNLEGWTVTEGSPSYENLDITYKQ